MLCVCCDTALENKLLSQICEQDDTVAFLPNSVFPPVETHAEAPEEENIEVMLLSINT